MDRREILEKLANKEIEQDEAERLLKEAGEALPPDEQGPSHPAPRGGGNRGCLIAILLILFIGVLLLGFSCLLFMV